MFVQNNLCCLNSDFLKLFFHILFGKLSFDHIKEVYLHTMEFLFKRIPYPTLKYV